MHAPVSTSNPFLAIARHHRVDYAVVLLFADWLKAGGKTEPDHYWHRWARDEIRKLTYPHARGIQDDVIETAHRLNGVNVHR